MTPLTIAEQSFLKLDTPQQAKPAAAKAVSGAGFGNVMAQAQEEAPTEAQTAIALETAEQNGAEPKTAKKAEAANSESAPAKSAETAIRRVPAQPSAADIKTLTADAQTVEAGEDILPVIARLPEGGLTTKAATSETAISRMTVKTTADGGKTAAALGQPVELAPKTHPLVDGEQVKLPDAASDTAEVALVNVASTIAEKGVVAAPEGAKPEVAKAEGTKVEGAKPEVGEIAQGQTEPSEKLRALNTTTSAAALTVQQTAAAETETTETPVTTHASLSLRAQITAKPAKAQAVAEVKADTLVEGATLTAKKGDTETLKSEAATQIVTPELAVVQGDAVQTPKLSTEVKADAEKPVEVEAEVAKATQDETLTVATAGAAVAAPIAARQSEAAQPVGRQSKAAPIVTGDRQPKTTAQRAEAQPAVQQAAQPQLTQRVGKIAEPEGPAIESASKAKVAETKPSLTTASFEQAIQQVSAQDTGIDLTEVATKPVELPQQAAAPQQPLAAIAPQVQVTTAPDAFQQLEAAARDVATTELAMDQAEWPENLIDNIGFETLPDGEAMDIQLTPENLGRVQLRMELRDGAASITIVTETSEAAKQFNDNQQKLADLLAKQGVELANHNASTGRDSGRNDQGGQTGSAQANNNQSDSTNGTGQTEAVTARKDPNRLVDVQA